ncbi:nadh:ubiquinone oxidoreductase 14kd subunit [Diaporthe eres]|nr:nadh:ubiquinone oxidoreductase 14kd subunit [Diaporthe eres]
MPQDMPPVGGYDAVQYKSRVRIDRPLPMKEEDHSRPLDLWDFLVPWSVVQEKQKYEDGIANFHRPPQRNLPARGFKPATLLALGGGVMLYGWYQFGKGAREQRELAREKMWARIHIIPALQAEEDRDQVRRYLADQQRERDLMGGENFKVYNNERFVKPTFAVTPEKSK